MSNITPNGVIKLLKNCPLDTTYEHTLFFNSRTSNNDPQYNYFNNLVKYTIYNNTYSRLNKGVLRIGKCADDVYDCNYLMFQNTSYGNKWFYAFIKSIEYINDGVCEIHFEIDVMQTWYYDYTLGQCFVEREHTASDNVGEHIVPENVDLGEYVMENGVRSHCMDTFSIVVTATFNYYYDDTEQKWKFDDDSPISGECYKADAPSMRRFTNNDVLGDGSHSSGNMDTSVASYYPMCPFTIEFICDPDGVEEFQEMIGNLDNRSEGIISIEILPTKREKAQTTSYHVKNENSVMIHKPYIPMTDNELYPDNSNHMLGNYKVKNNKLLTYPYNFLYVTNSQDCGVAYPYEFFDNSNFCFFGFSCNGNPNPVANLIPYNYKGVHCNYDERITISGFPQVPWTTDTFKAWLAQTSSSLPVTFANTLKATAFGASSGALMGGVAGAIAGGVFGAFASVSGVLANGYESAIKPDIPHSGGGSPSTILDKSLDFRFYNKHIRPEMARVIDDYFTKFGYAIHRLKTPNRSVRNYWCYTKTIGCVVSGSVPSDDMRKICEIYDKGITFWKCYKSECTVGNYALDNSPV